MKTRWLRIHSNKTETVLVKMGEHLKNVSEIISVLSFKDMTLPFSHRLWGSHAVVSGQSEGRIMKIIF